MRKSILAIMGLSIFLQGCTAILLGGAGFAYYGYKKSQTRETFLYHFNRINVERETAGLEPLDLCTEQYQFDRGWAMDDLDCSIRIEKYESGDLTALVERTGSTADSEMVRLSTMEAGGS